MDFFRSSLEDMADGFTKVFDKEEENVDEMRARGARWTEACGATTKARSSGSSYFDYLNADEGDVFIATDLEQIKLDVAQGRTNAATMHIISFADAINRSFPDSDAWQQSLQNVLTAYARRNHSPGYCQGQNLIVAFLLLHMDEEMAFWVLCTVVEDMRGADFYSKPPASMNGFMVEMQVVVKAATSLMPELCEMLGGEAELQQLIEVVSPKALIPLFVDQMSLSATVAVWEDFLCTEAGPDVTAVHTMLALFQLGATQRLLKEGATMATIGALMEEVNVDDLQEKIQESYSVLDVEQVLQMKMAAKAELAARWNDGTRWLRQLSRSTHFKQNELTELQKVFQTKCEGQAGITRTQFAELVANLPHKLPSAYVEHLYKLVDQDDNDMLDFRELVCWLSILTRGSMVERLQLCFNLYDVDRSGMLEAAEISAMAKALVRAGGQASPPAEAEVFEKKLRLMDQNRDNRISFLELHDGVQADMGMQMLLGCGDESEAVGGEDDEDDLCGVCKVELEAMQSMSISCCAPGESCESTDKVKSESSTSRKYVRMLLCEAENVHPKVRKAHIQVTHGSGTQRTGLATGAPKDLRLQFAWNQAFHIPFDFTFTQEGEFKSNVVKIQMLDASDGRVVASADLDIASHISESQPRAEVMLTMGIEGVLGNLLKHSVLNAAASISGKQGEATASPVLSLMLATHDCEGLRRDHSSYSFTFNQLCLRIHPDFEEKAPCKVKMEVSRAGRSVSTRMLDISTESQPDDEWTCCWDMGDALRVAVHMFYSDTYDEDGTYMQKNILCKIKDATTGATFAAARLDLSTYFTSDTSNRLVNIDLYAIEKDDDHSIKWLKSGWSEVTSLFGLGDPAATIQATICKEAKGGMAGVLEEPNRAAFSPTSPK